MGKLLAIDGLNIVRRVYEASPEPDSAEKADIALRHALSSFRKLLGAHAPTHVLAAFDYGGPTWRHELYPRYREQRAPMPSFLRDALPAFHDKLQAEGLHVLVLPEVEADDVIGTGVLRWLAEGRGEAIVAICLTEPRGGSDASNLQLRARRDGTDYVINGEKTSITFADRADGYIVFARTGAPESGARGITAFFVPGA